jgi:hypothetical protein
MEPKTAAAYAICSAVGYDFVYGTATDEGWIGNAAETAEATAWFARYAGGPDEARRQIEELAEILGVTT